MISPKRHSFRTKMHPLRKNSASARGICWVFVRCSYLVPLCGGDEDVVWYLEDSCGLSIPVEHQPSPPPPGPVGVARERRGITAKLSKRGASKIALPGTGCSVPSTGVGGIPGKGRVLKWVRRYLPPALFYSVPCFTFSLGRKAFSYGHGALTPSPGVVYIIWRNHGLVHGVCHGNNGISHVVQEAMGCLMGCPMGPMTYPMGLMAYTMGFMAYPMGKPIDPMAYPMSSSIRHGYLDVRHGTMYAMA